MIDPLGDFVRTKYCGEVCEEDEGKKVNLCGWVHRVRDHGGVLFLDLRDREGLIQVVFEETANPEIYTKAQKLRSEWVVGVSGRVRRRPPGRENPKIRTGFFEVVAEDLKIFARSEVPPFSVEEETAVSEELKLRYRYIDLRRESMKENLLFRHRAYSVIRNFLNSEGFVEIETPYLTKSTPEGARDFIVPSRLHAGKFYALPQSPQLFKQLLMVAGFDRYFQIVRCFRDEDLRADRQPEFTQIDFEMSFVSEEQVMDVSERLIARLFQDLLGIEINLPLERVSYQEAMERYGTDRPDRRFGIELTDLSDLFAKTEFRVFRDAIDRGGCVKAIKVSEVSLSRKDLDELTEFVKGLGAKGLAWLKLEKDRISSPIVKFFTEQEKDLLIKRLSLTEGDTVLFSADSRENVHRVLGALRLHIGKKFSLIDKSRWDIFWVTDFPLIEWDPDEHRFVSLHHPFTSPKEEDISKLEMALETDDFEERRILIESVKSRAYDLVINGEEVGGGSIRIHNRDVQELIFRILGISDEEAREKFGFLLEALRFGAPPHGGLAFGLDRLIAIMRGLDSIRDVIAFPKTQKGICPLTSAPSEVEKDQLRDVHLKILE